MALHAVGVSFASRHPVRSSPELVPAYVDAFTAASWHRPLRYFLGIIDAPKPAPRRPGVLKTKTLRAELAELLTSDGLSTVTLLTSAKNDDRFAAFTAQTHLEPHYEFVRAYGRHYLNDEVLPAMDRWVLDMLAFAVAAKAAHGIVTVMNEDGAAAEVSYTGRSRDGRDLHPFPDEFERMCRVQREIGTKYVRFPRWGTMYSREHVDALGGVQRILDVVRPAVVRDLGDAIYFQLTEGVATAMSAEAMQKQRLFTELAGALLPPVGARS